MAYTQSYSDEQQMRHRAKVYDIMNEIKDDLLLRLGKAVQSQDPKVLGELVMNAWNAGDKYAEKLVDQMASRMDIDAFFGNYKKIEEHYEDEINNG